MYSPNTSRADSNPNYPPAFCYTQLHQPSTNAYQYSQGRPMFKPLLNTGHSSNSQIKDSSSSYGSSDSGYGTGTPSVASSTLQQNCPTQSYPTQSYPTQSYPTQSYPTQSYPAQSYPVQSYVPNRQPSQPSADFPYGRQRGPDIEVIRSAPVPSSKQKKERRLSTPSPSLPSEYHCQHPNCGHISSHAHDLKRHMTVHFPPPVEDLLDCKYEWCGRTGAHGFKREDHLKEHYRKVHSKENEDPKWAKSGRSVRSEERRSKYWVNTPTPTKGRQSSPAFGHPSVQPAPTTMVSGSVKQSSTPVQTQEITEKSGVEPTNRKIPTTLAKGRPSSSKLEPPSIEPGDATSPPDMIGKTGLFPIKKPVLDEVYTIHSTNPESENKRLRGCVPDDLLTNVSFKDRQSPQPSLSPRSLMADPDKLWQSDNSEAFTSDDFNDESEAEVSNGDECYAEVDLSKERTSSESEVLVSSISHQSSGDKLSTIQDLVFEAFPVRNRGSCHASVTMQWDILTFMENQYHDNDSPNKSLGAVITISGSALHAQAATCSEYVRQIWPSHGLQVLNAIQDAVDDPKHTSTSSLPSDFGSGNDEAVSETSMTFRSGTVKNPPRPTKVVSRPISTQSVMHEGVNAVELEIDLAHATCVLNIRFATPQATAKIIQQIVWMAAALRTSSKECVEYSEPRFLEILQSDGDKPASFKLCFDSLSLLEEERSCWYPLFTNPVIARHFPTAERRNDEVGLEIPLEMMAALGGARHAVDFEGGLVLKGYSTLFVPIRRHQESVQWHLICARGEDRISYREASEQYPNRALLKDLSHEALRTTRAYLGWWKEAETHLATRDVDYEGIDWSKAKEAGPSPRLTGGSLGISKIITAQVNFVLGAKDGSFHYSQQEPFQKTVDRAENLPVLLYDQKDRRAWLVSALPVILHIIQLRNHTKPFFVDGKKVELSPLDPSRQGHAAREAVNKNKLLKLFDSESNEEKNYCFRDAILDTWSILDRLMEREATMQAIPGMTMQARLQSTLYGWEFKAVADEERHLKQKTQILEKTAGRWTDLVKDVDAVGLFASGLGDIIKPRTDLGGLCRKWRSLPKDKDYLAVCVPMLETFYAKAGHRQDHQYLTSAKLEWHRGSVLFEKCAGVASRCYECNRLQQVYHDSYKTIGQVIPPGKLEANGCVVFGKAHHPFKPPKPVLLRQNAVHSLPNISIKNGDGTRQISTENDGLLSPSPPASASTEPEEINGYGIRSPRGQLSPLKRSDDLLQVNGVASKKMCIMFQPDMSNPDTCKGPQIRNDQTLVPQGSAVFSAEYTSMAKPDTGFRRQGNVPAQIACASETEHEPVNAWKTIRRKSKFEVPNHRHGCSCTTCSTVEFKHPNRIESTNTANGAQGIF